jgi:hypothetical protein
MVAELMSAMTQELTRLWRPALANAAGSKHLLCTARDALRPSLEIAKVAWYVLACFPMSIYSPATPELKCHLRTKN